MGMGVTPAAWLGFQEPHPQRKLTLLPLEATNCDQILSCGQGSCARLSSMLDCGLTWSCTGNHRCELVKSAGPISLQSSPLWLLHSRCPLSWEGPWALAVVLSVLYGHPFVPEHLLTFPLHSLIRFEFLLCPLHKETSLVRSESHTKEVHLMSQNTIPFGEPPGVCVFRHSAVVDGVFHTSGSRLWMLLFGSVMPSLISLYRFSLAAKTMNYW